MGIYREEPKERLRLQSNQVKRTPLDSINGSIIWKLNPLVVSKNAFIYSLLTRINDQIKFRRT